MVKPKDDDSPSPFDAALAGAACRIFKVEPTVADSPSISDDAVAEAVCSDLIVEPTVDDSPFNLRVCARGGGLQRFYSGDDGR